MPASAPRSVRSGRVRGPVLSVRPPLPPGVWLRPGVVGPPFPLERGGARLCASSRHALWHGLHALGLSPGDEVLTPAYHHGSEVEAMTRAGLACRFYDCGASLEPDPDALESLLGERTRALHVTHYLGLPQPMARWRRWCDERDLFLVEDASQAWLASVDGRPAGAWGDLALFSLGPTVGLPGVAAFVCPAPVAPPRLETATGARELLRRYGAWLSGRWAPAAVVLEGLRRAPASYSAERDCELRDPDATPSRSTRLLLERLADPELAVARRAHYRLLLEDLGERVPEPWGALPDGSSPMVFPVAVDDKPAFLAQLAGRGVRGLDLWPEPHPTLPAAAFPDAARRRASVVGLPVHQELRAGDIERIVAAAEPRRRRSDLVLERLERLDDAREEWTQLAAASGNVFGTWEWASTWWRHFGEGHRLVLLRCRDRDGRTVALLPLCARSVRGLRILRFLGHGPGDQLGPLCRVEDRPATARALRRALDSVCGRWDLFLGERLGSPELWAGRLGATVLRREGNPVIRFQGSSWAEHMASESRNLRGQAGRKERRLERAHDMKLRLSGSRELPADFDTLIRLHHARWGAGSNAFAGARGRFHRDFVAVAMRRGWARLWIMELDGRPAAAWYGLRFGGAESYYQAGRDPAWEPWSVGFVLLVHTMREANRDGMEEYRLLRGDEAYKSRFTIEDSGLETVGLAGGLAGRASIATARRIDDLPDRGRQALRSLIEA